MAVSADDYYRVISEGVETAVIAGSTIDSVKMEAGDLKFYNGNTAVRTQTSCGCSVEITTGDPVDLTGITLDVTSATLFVNDKLTLTATKVPANANNYNSEWSVTPEGIVTVTQTGEVTAVAAGEATVTVKSGEIEASATLTVATPAQLDKTGWVMDSYDVKGIGVEVPDRTPDKMIDPLDTSGQWAVRSMWHATWGAAVALPFWFIIDMQESHLISQYKIYIPEETINDLSLKTGYFEVSDDKQTWNKKVEFDITEPLASDWTVEALPQTSGRYIRFTISTAQEGANRLAISSLEVFGH
ncbi:MAG: Ig-like domain-containing protein [Dysgonamonadaceae bacterium]|nr:Ig-like domain-containing protein [Dysgonamonadaceae bacterium]